MVRINLSDTFLCEMVRISFKDIFQNVSQSWCIVISYNLSEMIPFYIIMMCRLPRTILPCLGSFLFFSNLSLNE